jgi:hypothetical protein
MIFSVDSTAEMSGIPPSRAIEGRIRRLWIL